MSVYLRRFLAAVFLLFVGVLSASDISEQNEALEAEIDAAVFAMSEVAEDGPIDIELSDQAVLKLPSGFYFVPKKQAAAYMDAIGNSVGDEFLGLVFSEELDGFVSIDFYDEGFIQDKDAKNWDVDELFNSLKEGTEYDNKERAKRGIPEFEVVDWIEKPRYDENSHQLIWSILLRDKYIDEPIEEQSVNYNTYLLGREGYISLNLITGMDFVEEGKPLAKKLLSSLAFNEGKRYEDFNADTDRVAEYGLAALIGGIAAKKLGLLAVVGVFLAKFWKIAIIAFIALGIGLRKFLGRKKD